MRSTFDLNGKWDLAYYDEIEPYPKLPSEVSEFRCDRIPAVVPGNVELDLARAGLISADPFFGLNILEVRRFESYQWWYFREFPTPDWSTLSGTEIVFEGLDCFATIWVNDIEMGRCENSMIGHRFDISSALRSQGETNRIAIRLASPINAVRDLPIDLQSVAGPYRWESLWARKPAHAYGWDIMPRVLSAGIWRSVRLEEKPPTELTDFFLDTIRISEDEALVEARYAFRTDKPLRDFSIRVDGKCGSSLFMAVLPVPSTQGAFQIQVPNPALWWPHGYGDPALYDVVVTLLYAGSPLSGRQFHFGIRTVELDHTDLHTPESPGRFSFVVNGMPIFCRGSNWVPIDAFHSRDADRIPQVLALVADLECNMVRCWGGNVYETHQFYDICDRQGILVWQDFGMACAAYPQAPEFLETIKSEAIWVVRELRQHPSIVLWSGDNEVDELHVCWHAERTDPDKNRLTREILPEVVRLLDRRRPYLPSSPHFPSAALAFERPNRVVPEQHLWGPRNYYKSDFYLHNTAIFVSEIGYHGCPRPSSIRRFISPGKLWPNLNNEEWDLHSTDPIPELPQFQRIRLMHTQVREMFGPIPDGLDHFALASQIVQAEAMKFFLELFRQQKGRTTGILWWNIMDGWPQMSDAIVDYFFEKKLAYWYLKRAHSPFTIVVHEPDATHRLEVSAVNDTLASHAGTVRIWDADTGETLFESPFVVGPSDRSRCGFIEVDGSEQRLFLFSWQDGGRTGCGHYLLGRPPFNYERYRSRWLPQIAALDGTFQNWSWGTD